MPQRFSLLLILLFCLPVFGCEKEAEKSAAHNVLKVRLAEAAAVSIEEEASFNATLVAKETVEIRAKVHGYLKERLFTEGSLVMKGATLYTLDDRELTAAYERAKAATAKAEAAWKNDVVIRDRYKEL
jgi:membrane fusion protein (multidrug efflux system)